MAVVTEDTSLQEQASAPDSVRVLVVDDEYAIRESCASVLECQGHDVTVAGQGSEAARLLRTSRFDVALLDLYMSEVSGLELLSIVREVDSPPIPIIMTGRPSVGTSVEAMRAGAVDYLPKPFSATQLQLSIGRASYVLFSRQPPAEHADRTPADHGEKLTILGASPAIQRVIEQARRVAPTDASVFLIGESGTGKELVAKLIHKHSHRAARPMISLNCAALPETLLESEMFGHCRGAFTGASRDKAGLLEVADGGTMFLDELLEMPLPIQAKLLRVLEDGLVRRVGSTTTDAVVDVRFIAATNRDPVSASNAGDLRTDLFFRLSVVPIRLPNLRERPEDIPLLARHFLARYWTRHRGEAEIPSFSEESLQALRERSWPGNVRELENTIERAVVFLSPGAEIGPEDLLSDPVSPVTDTLGSGPHLLGVPYHEARDRLLDDFERDYVRRVLAQAEGNLMRAARIAGVDRTTLYRLMQKRGLKRRSHTSQPG